MTMSIWDDIADSREEAENLKVRAALMRAVRAHIADAGWSQAAAADHLSLTQPRVSDLFRGKISKFSLDALVEIASKLGIHVRVEVDEDRALPA
jgi:predicted XRE-type DNA-binding protein